MRKVLKTAMMAALLTTGFYGVAHAEYPERPVTFIVPWPPGDLEDQLTRIIADEFTKMYHVPAKVVNVAGGGGVVGEMKVANSPADGYTVGSFTIDASTVQIIRKTAPITRSTFEPIGIFLTYPFGLVAKKDAPYNNLKELATYAKTHNVKLGHYGYDLIPTMETFQAAKELGFKFGANAAFDMLDCSTLANGDADVINTTMATVLPCLDKVKAIAAYTDKPLSIFPNTKLLSQQVPGLDVSLWDGLFVKKGTPAVARKKIEAAAIAALKGAKAQGIAKSTGAGVYWMNASASKARIDRDYKAVEKLVQEAK